MPPIHEANYIPNASNAVFNNLNITHTTSNSERNGLRRLLENVSAGAFHNAAERGEPPKCHPNTRISIRAEIMEWLNKPEARRKFIIWMYGPAGAGKTAIAQSIAEECMEQGLLAASFFFGRTAPGRNDMTRVVATIAYQISRYLSQVEDHLLTAIEWDPTIFTRSLATQMQAHVVEPLKALPPLPQPIFVILDGLDEAGPTSEPQASLLNIIYTAIAELQHIPLIFLIASRPEYEIRDPFNGNLSPLTQSLVLDDNYKPDDDIRLYFTSTFEEIRDKHIEIETRLPSPWPSKSDVDRLVSKASGQFIFAATVLKFIDSIRHNPDNRLSIILGLSAPGNETPFALLDELYRYILSSVTEPEEVLAILRMLVLQNPKIRLRLGDVAELLGLEVQRVLVDMHALVFVPPPNNSASALRIHHASLYDFLTDRSRSQEFYIDANQGHLDFTNRWWAAIANYQSSELDLQLCLWCFIYHYKKSPGSNDLIIPLSSLDLTQRLEDHGDLRNLYSAPWKEFFECINQQAEHQLNLHDIVPRLEDQIKGFVLEQVSKYPPALQIYIPTILTLSRHNQNVRDIFRLLLCSLHKPLMECNDILALDSTLLCLHQGPFDVDAFFHDLFYNSERCLALAKQLVRIIFPKHGEDNCQLKFKETPYSEKTSVFSIADGFLCVPLYELNFRWFRTMLRELPEDSDLAILLHERALQYNGNDLSLEPGRYEIACCGLEYIQWCGIPYLNHTHPPSTNKCIICEKCDGASVLVDLDQQNEPDAAAVSPLSPPESPLRFAKADDLPNDLEELCTAIPVDPPGIFVATESSPAPIWENPNSASPRPSSSEPSAIHEPATTSKRKRGARSPSAELTDTRLRMKKTLY